MALRRCTLLMARGLRTLQFFYSLYTLLLFCILIKSSFVEANDISIEGGVVLMGNSPTGTGSDPAYPSIGFSGQFSYEIERWGFGVRTHGTISPDTELNILAGSYELHGNLARRQYGLETLARYFFLDSNGKKSWYVQLGFLAIQTDFIHADTVTTLPESQDYTRIFLRGSGFSFGLGYRPKNGPWFYQINYELDHYETLQIVGEVKSLHPTLAEPSLNSAYFINRVYVMVGLDIFGR